VRIGEFSPADTTALPKSFRLSVGTTPAGLPPGSAGADLYDIAAGAWLPPGSGGTGSVVSDGSGGWTVSFTLTTMRKSNYILKIYYFSATDPADDITIITAWLRGRWWPQVTAGPAGRESNPRRAV
jgi:hypothetical protein